MAKGYFITGAGADVGKTLVSCALQHALGGVVRPPTSRQTTRIRE